MKKKVSPRILFLVAVCLLLVAGFVLSRLISLDWGFDGWITSASDDPHDKYYYDIHVNADLPIRIRYVHLPENNNNLILYVRGDYDTWVNGVDGIFGRMPEEMFAPVLPHITQQFSYGESSGRGDLNASFVFVLRSDHFYELGSTIPLTVDYSILGLIPASQELLLEIPQ